MKSCQERISNRGSRTGLTCCLGAGRMAHFGWYSCIGYLMEERRENEGSH